MAGPEHDKLEHLFSAALQKDSHAERNAFLDSVCGEDHDLKTQVQELLRAHDRAGAFLEVPPVEPVSTLEVWKPSQATGTKIGRYKILQEIGEGGFGTVFMAEQEEPVRRKVALKIIKLGMDTKQVIARFEAERQALALMDHPNIAKVLDAGATETGRPFFVMELVKGITVTEYCDQNKLSTRQRLELFLPICDAIQHAHQKGVIHRDLKPNNVLVTLDENKPVPKVIDFGIAKATSQRLTEKTLFTEFRQFLGTPEYMSPDQAETSGLDVDTRTDIYSLGVLLYELLTSTTPFDAKTLRAASYEEIRGVIREVEPPKPSMRLQTLSQTKEGTDVAKFRRAEPTGLSRLIRGDLDWIIMKAMEKDRTLRYATAKDLADDIQRHLRYEPVLASPPNLGYRCRKFVRRHRVGVIAGTVVGAAIITGLSLATAGLIEANRARDALRLERDTAQAARVEAENARASEQEHAALAEVSAREARKEAIKSATVSQFLQEMLRSVDPTKALGREVTVRYVLDEAARGVNKGSLAEQPEVEASIRMALGETYEALGLYDAAEAHLRQAAALRSQQLTNEHADTLQSHHALAKVLRVKGQFAEAEVLLRQTAETRRRILGEEDPDTLMTMNELALSLWGPGRFAEAESIHRRILQIQQRVLGEQHINTIQSRGHLGMVCRALGKSAEAEGLLTRALELCRGELGEEHAYTAEAMNNLGLLREDQRDYEQAEALYRQTYEWDRRVFGPDHPKTQVPMNNLMRILKIQGDVAGIRPLVAERLSRLSRAAERPNAGALALHAYAWELLSCEPVDLQNPIAALPFAERAVELDGGRDASLLDTLAAAYDATNDLDRAIETQRLAIAQAQIGGPYNRTELQSRLVDYLSQKGDLVGVAALSWEGWTQRIGDSFTTESTAGAALILRSEELIEEGRFEEAAATLRGCLAMRQKALPTGHWLIPDTMSQLGGALAGKGDFAEAEPLLLDAHVELSENRQAPPDRDQRAIERIVQLYEAWNKPDQAESWRLTLQKAAESGINPPNSGD